VVPWLAGVPADLVGPWPDQATTLGRFLHALHIPALEERRGRLSAHPRNILVDRGRLSAVIDWGDVTRGDPATDLAAIWMLFPSRAHRQATPPMDRYHRRRSAGRAAEPCSSAWS
jgi:aminoglycoside phosphotransferase (APT) family kinase protein